MLFGRPSIVSERRGFSYIFRAASGQPSGSIRVTLLRGSGDFVVAAGTHERPVPRAAAANGAE